MSKNENSNLLIDDIIKKDIEVKRDLINNVVNFNGRIPIVQYKMERCNMHICSRYVFSIDIFINVVKEDDKFNISFVNNDFIDLFDKKITENHVLNKDVDNSLFLKSNKNPIIIISGASGCGKSTLSYLLASIIKIKNVISTDIIREILRKYKVKGNMFLRYSTYESWKLTSSDNEEIKEKKIENRKFDKKRDDEIEEKNIENRKFDKERDQENRFVKINNIVENEEGYRSEKVKRRCIKNYLKQCELVFNLVNDIVDDHIKKDKPLIIEGVHLNSENINKLIKKYPKKIIYFLVYLTDKETSIKRFSSRINSNTNEINKYVKYINYIKDIQTHLLESSKKLSHTVNYIENANIYKSLEDILKIIYLFV